jgi:hypothetical protein
MAQPPDKVTRSPNGKKSSGIKVLARNAITGRFVTMKYARKNPNMVKVERIKKK